MLILSDIFDYFYGYKNMDLRSLLFTLAILLYSGVHAQNTDVTYGKNRIQYEQFVWKSYVSDNFEVFFYGENKLLVKDLTNYIESELDGLLDIMGHVQYSRIKIFIYNSISDLQQSNVGINYRGAVSGGETQFVKSYIEAAHPGTLELFKSELKYKVTQLLLNDMLYGGSLKDMLQSTLLNLPEWFTEGAALYIAKGWTLEMDDYIRELLISGKFKKLSKLKGNDAALAGQSIWNYIAERHGSSNIQAILNYIKIIRNEEKSIAITLGLSLKDLIEDWKNFYIDHENNLAKNYTSPESEWKITDRNKKDRIYRNINISPDGLKLSYTENDRGKYRIIVREEATGNETIVLTGGLKVVNQEIDPDIPLVSWIDDNTLGIIDNKHGNVTFSVYDLLTNTKTEDNYSSLDQVKSISFSANGRLGILSATVNGVSDLYLISTRRNRIRRLTNDIFDDVDATFVPNTNTILFSSNRTSDTLNLKSMTLSDISDNFNLFYYNLDTTQNILKRITNTISKDYLPIQVSNNEIVYLSDQKGIINLFKYNTELEMYSQITNYNRSISSFDMNLSNKSLAFISTNNNKDQLFYGIGFDYNQQKFTPPSIRQQKITVKRVRSRKLQRENDPELSIKELIDKKLQIIEENSKIDTIDTDSVRIVSGASETLDTDKYTFEAPAPITENTNFLLQYRSRRQANREINGPYPYETLFSADNIINQIIIDPIWGFGIALEAEMVDLLENHNFNGGIRTTFDFKNGDIFAEYHYRRLLIDYNIRFDRKAILWRKGGENPADEKYSLNRVEVGASYPLNVKSRVSVKPALMQTTYNDLGQLDRNSTPVNPVTFQDEVNKTYFSGTLEYIFDNSIAPGMNIQEGTKAKVAFNYNENFGDSRYSFGNIMADIRHYQKVHKEIVFATRLFYGKFFGNDPKSYTLGGVDNWVFNRTNEGGSSNPINPNRAGDRSEILFTNYLTSVRGFDYASLYGSNAMLFNAELRLPLVQYLNSGYISSNFFRNIQFIGFLDVGSSWSGASPFNPSNTISTEVVTEGSYRITLKNFKNPWLTSYGLGFRTMIFNYYARFDLAWPLEDNIPSPPKLSVSLGFDF